MNLRILILGSLCECKIIQIKKDYFRFTNGSTLFIFCYFVPNNKNNRYMSEILTTPIIKFTFSGHETFHCRQLWLKKGYDFVKNGNKFTDNESVVLLGVGKNMVSAL